MVYDQIETFLKSFAAERLDNIVNILNYKYGIGCSGICSEIIDSYRIFAEDYSSIGDCYLLENYSLKELLIVKSS